LARHDHVIDGTRIDEHTALAVEDDAARRWNWQATATLVLRDLGVSFTTHDLKYVKPNAERAEHHHHQDLNKPQPRAKVLRCIFEFHVCAFLWLTFSSAVPSNDVRPDGAWR